ncbi:hypothetical protein [Anatilimnocola floriformis]|uniref:hypothetical protein n=1 Tax=Anatilimnocola floriformis TaxID=2948575 RepID=UPI0020C38E4A|nr:hypothetical protein [Anatilimnocola floriformis]
MPRLPLSFLAACVLTASGLFATTCVAQQLDYYAGLRPASAQAEVPPEPPADPLLPAPPLPRPVAPEPALGPAPILSPGPVEYADGLGGEPVEGQQRVGLYRATRHALFRLYAGPAEMQDKVYYPRGYYGNYYFRGWKPDYIYPLPPPPARDYKGWYRGPHGQENEFEGAIPVEAKNPRSIRK